jgi:hypothetical protein
MYQKSIGGQLARVFDLLDLGRRASMLLVVKATPTANNWVDAEQKELGGKEFERDVTDFP